MPRRRNREPLPKYSFVTVEPKGSDVSWLKEYSGSTRSHAAYWGGTGKFQFEDEKNSIKQHDDTISIFSDADKGGGAAAHKQSSKSQIEQNLSVYSPDNESPLQLNALVSSRAELDSNVALQTSSRQCEHGRGEGMPSSLESAYNATSLDSHTSQELVVGSPSHQQTNFTANIPGFLSPYPCGKGFSARDSDRYLAFCGFKITREPLGQFLTNFIRVIEKVVPRVTARQWIAVDNPYLSFAIPASMESDILRHAIHALTASQVAPISNNPKLDSFKALWHKQNVIHLLRKSLVDWAPPSSATLVACYIMLIFEIRHSKAQDWYQWLQGAILLIESRDRLGEDICNTGVWSTFTKNIVVNETLSAVSTNTGARLSSKYWKAYLRSLNDLSDSDLPVEDLVLQKCQEDKYFESLRGCPTAVMLVLAEITEHLELRKLGGPADDTISTQRKYQRWETLLLRCYSSTLGASMMHLAESFRYAALVYLLRRIRRLPYTDSAVQSYVHLTLEHIFCLDSAKPGFNATWPKMIAGLELDELEYPHLATRLLHDIRNTHLIRSNLCRDRSHDESEELLLSTWLQRKKCRTWEERVAVDWLDIATVGGRRLTIW